ncbi:unnamed protein product [Caenorhabditis bovis]|uniref:Uncharacterized protein n=1 Tax=Caenorhabditis bovis TaxID=2654633 RepID=A0A8S1F1M8_9PELO|nr:unnamed protein product [Caenorhabditis bovis]
MNLHSDICWLSLDELTPQKLAVIEERIEQLETGFDMVKTNGIPNDHSPYEYYAMATANNQRAFDWFKELKAQERYQKLVDRCDEAGENSTEFELVIFSSYVRSIFAYISIQKDIADYFNRFANTKIGLQFRTTADEERIARIKTEDGCEAPPLQQPAEIEETELIKQEPRDVEFDKIDCSTNDAVVMMPTNPLNRTGLERLRGVERARSPPPICRPLGGPTPQLSPAERSEIFGSRLTSPASIMDQTSSTRRKSLDSEVDFCDLSRVREFRFQKSAQREDGEIVDESSGGPNCSDEATSDVRQIDESELEEAEIGDGMDDREDVIESNDGVICNKSTNHIYERELEDGEIVDSDDDDVMESSDANCDEDTINNVPNSRRIQYDLFGFEAEDEPENSLDSPESIDVEDDVVPRSARLPRACKRVATPIIDVRPSPTKRTPRRRRRRTVNVTENVDGMKKKKATRSRNPINNIWCSTKKRRGKRIVNEFVELQRSSSTLLKTIERNPPNANDAEKLIELMINDVAEMNRKYSVLIRESALNKRRLDDALAKLLDDLTPTERNNQAAKISKLKQKHTDYTNLRNAINFKNKFAAADNNAPLPADHHENRNENDVDDGCFIIPSEDQFRRKRKNCADAVITKMLDACRISMECDAMPMKRTRIT